MPITLNVAVKPAPTIAKPQDTVDYHDMTNSTLEGNDGYEACLVPGLVPCVEAAVNIALLSHMMDYPNFC